MNIKTIFAVSAVLFLAGCASIKTPPVDMSNSEVRAAYEDGKKEASAEILVIDKCRAKNQGRTESGVPSKGNCRVNGDYSGYYGSPNYYIYNNIYHPYYNPRASIYFQGYFYPSGSYGYRGNYRNRGGYGGSRGGHGSVYGDANNARERVHQDADHGRNH